MVNLTVLMVVMNGTVKKHVRTMKYIVHQTANAFPHLGCVMEKKTALMVVMNRTVYKTDANIQTGLNVNLESALVHFGVAMVTKTALMEAMSGTAIQLLLPPLQSSQLFTI